MKTILISEELYSKIAEIAGDLETPEEMAEHMLNAQITVAMQKDTFYPARKFEFKTLHIQAKLFEVDSDRLSKWLQNHDDLELLPCKNELFILNNSIQ